MFTTSSHLAAVGTTLYVQLIYHIIGYVSTQWFCKICALLFIDVISYEVVEFSQFSMENFWHRLVKEKQSLTGLSSDGHVVFLSSQCPMI